MLEVRNLAVAYGKHEALHGVSLTVKPGEIVVILGANGAGKSTLLKAVAGICEGKAAGEVALSGQPLLGLPAHKVVNEGVALVPEGRGIFGELTVAENLTLGAYAPHAKEEEPANRDRIFSLFPKLAERRGQTARTMSGGEQQMVAIGRAMMSNPTILMLDEPSLGLSPLLSRELFQSLSRIRDAGIGILLVEQNAKLSLSIADRGYLLENGRILEEAPAKQLLADPAVQAAYLGAAAKAAPADALAEAHAAGPHAEGPVPAPVPEGPAALIRPRAATVPSADTLIGTSIADLVARASERGSREAAPARKAPPAPATGDRLKATLAEIERAAAAARMPGRIAPKPTPRREPPAPDAAAAAEPGPVARVEVYRAPRVEIYRRRDGSTEFERQ